MMPHTKIYLQHFGFGIDDFIPCEVCGAKSVDIHHIQGRGKNKNVIINLVAVCRKCHRAAHGLEKTYLHKDIIQQIHNEYLQRYENTH